MISAFERTFVMQQQNTMIDPSFGDVLNRNVGLENKQDMACFCIELKTEITTAILWDMM